MSKLVWGSLLRVGTVLALGACTTTAAHDAGMLRDAAPPEYDAGPLGMDSGMVGVGTVYVRMANLIPASPNLTVCIATRPGTGIGLTTAHIIGQPDASIMSDGTLPGPGVSPYLPAPVFDAPGFGYQIRLYDRAQLPFSSLAACPDEGAQPAPVAVIELDASHVMVGHHYTAALIGVLPGTPVECAGTCPAVQVRMFEDDMTPPTGRNVRVRLFNGIPNLPAPIHICFDPDYVDAAHPGLLPETRSLPPAADTDGIAFGEVTPFIAIPEVVSMGAFYTHATVAGQPDCSPATLLQGPVTVPLPVPDSAPVDVARVFARGDVITNFAFGRVGSDCNTASDCVAPSSICSMAACTCDSTSHCVDDLAGNLLPWRDVRGDAPVDAGTSNDAGVDGGP